jgi:hypothetical protein
MSAVHVLEPGMLPFSVGCTDGRGQESAEGQEGAEAREAENEEEDLRYRSVLEAAQSAGFNGFMKVVQLHEVFGGTERKGRLRRLLKVCLWLDEKMCILLNEPSPVSTDLDVLVGDTVRRLT